MVGWGSGFQDPRSRKKPIPDPGGVKKAHANETTWYNSETYRDNVSYCVTESALFHSNNFAEFLVILRFL